MSNAHRRLKIPGLAAARRFQLKSLQREYKRGDKLAPIRALLDVLNYGMRSPDWLTEYFSTHIEQWLSLEAKTLDQALGVEWKKGKSFEAARRARRLEERIYNEVTRLHVQKGLPIDEGLFEQVAKSVEVGKTKAAEIYYRAKDDRQFLSSEWEWRHRYPDAYWRWPARLPQKPTNFRNYKG